MDDNYSNAFEISCLNWCLLDDRRPLLKRKVTWVVDLWTCPVASWRSLPEPLPQINGRVCQLTGSHCPRLVSSLGCITPLLLVSHLQLLKSLDGFNLTSTAFPHASLCREVFSYRVLLHCAEQIIGLVQPPACMLSNRVCFVAAFCTSDELAIRFYFFIIFLFTPLNSSNRFPPYD